MLATSGNSMVKCVTMIATAVVIERAIIFFILRTAAEVQTAVTVRIRICVVLKSHLNTVVFMTANAKAIENAIAQDIAMVFLIARVLLIHDPAKLKNLCFLGFSILGPRPKIATHLLTAQAAASAC